MVSSVKPEPRGMGLVLCQVNHGDGFGCSCQFSKNNSDECYYKKNKVSRDGKNVARLDHDDTHGYGKETITINKGNRYNYKYYVKNYSYRNHPGNDTLGKSNARVQVYYGNKPFPMYSLDVPQEKGIIWDVFEYDGQTGVSIYQL